MPRLHKYEVLAAELAELIAAGTYREGAPLPSVRELSQQKEFSISTVLQAYYLLEARGLIASRPRSGFFVAEAAVRPELEPEPSAPEFDAARVSIRQLVTQVALRDARTPGLVPLGYAHPNPGCTATGALNRIMAAIARREGDLSGAYDLPPGYRPLRTEIARQAARAGCRLNRSDIVITSGCTEAVSLCLQAVCQPGDTVAIESPICFDTLQTLETLHLRALEIPTHPRNGISLEALRFAVESMPVKACLVIANFNNPLGSRIPDAAKQELVKMLADRGIPLIENDIFGEIHFDAHRPATAKAFDQKGLVLLCSSFSKTLCPGYRVGWVAAGRFRDNIEWFKYTLSLAVPTLPQMAIATFMAGSGYPRHLRRMRRIYADNLAAMRRAVLRYFPADTRVTRPAGGYLLWIQLPGGINAYDLYRRALRAGIAIMPGHLFSAADRYHDFIRLTAAFWSPEVESAIRRLGALIAAETGGT
jgi:DNA-binding transcriptional MocR family regulator